MTSIIRVLDDALVDQIAAGEVVERPASVAKELIENAIDARAGFIEVAIEAGGTRALRITDDGVGMSPEDAARSVLRHATSKIRNLQDLESIQTMGFRGEALASIASVSRFTLRTRAAEAISGTEVTIEGGGAPRISEVGCAAGTTVRVDDLFFNVPARKKFLKSVGTESARVAEVFRRVALAEPHLRMRLLRDGRKSIDLLPGGALADRVGALWPKQSFELIEAESERIRVQALLGAPESARSGAGGLHLFVNRRAIRDRGLARAVAFAYGSVLPPGRYPIGVVQLTLDPERVDVNVHPQKLEVRFDNARAVMDELTKGLSTALAARAWSLPMRRPAFDVPSAAPATDLPSTSPQTDPWGLSTAPANLDGAPPYMQPTERLVAASPTLLNEGGFFSSLRVLGQVRRMLIVCEGQTSLVMIDQHAADERVRFDKLRRAYQDKGIGVQRLLIPDRFDVTEAQVQVCEDRAAELERFGFDVAVVGERSIAVHAIPALLQRARPEQLLRDALAELERKGERAFSDVVDMALATMACHGAIRAGDSLSIEECQALLKSLDEVLDFGTHCPHGRPVAHTQPFEEIERKLGR